MITIEVKPTIEGKTKQSLHVSFPFDMNLVAKIKSLPRRAFHRLESGPVWEVPIRDIDLLLEAFRDEPITMRCKVWTNLDPVERKILEKVSKVVRFEKPDLTGFRFKTQPFPHQVEGFNYAQEHPRFHLGDEQGLGKTKQAIDIAVSRRHQFKHCLIVCGVNSVKLNWYHEIQTHSNEKARLIGMRWNARRQEWVEADNPNRARLEDLNSDLKEFFLIINIEALRNAEIADKLAKMCKDGTIGMVVVDEIHKAKNPSASQTKGLLKLQSYYRLSLSGTPLMNSPLDLYTVLKWLGVEQHSFTSFKRRYCVFGGYGGYEIIGYRNLDELRKRLESVQLRRLKKDVLNLPPKIRKIEYVEMGPAQRRIYHEILRATRENIDKIKLSPNPLAQLIRLRQATGAPELLSSSVTESAKMDRLEELVEELAESGQKAIVFSNWEEMTAIARRRLARFNPAYVTGQVDNATRFNEINRFQNDPDCKVIIGTIGALGTGVTLTAAQTVIFLDKPWNMANTEQAEDRAHRIGTTGTVNIITLVCAGTIDERIEEIIQMKADLADALVDGDAVKLNKLVDFLLS